MLSAHSLLLRLGQSGAPLITYNFLSGSLRPDVTFARASAATYYNSAGVLSSASSGVPRFDYDPVALTPKGLLIEESRSNSISNSVPPSLTNSQASGGWQSFNNPTTAAAGTAPDGTNSAVSVTDGVAASVQHSLFPTSANNLTSGNTYTYSIYAKSNAHNIFQIFARQASNYYANYNLNTGVVTQQQTGCTAIITPAGNGWYRCSLTFTASSTGPFECDIVTLVNNNPTALYQPAYTGTNSGVYVWGAQIEAGSFPTSYIPTVGSTVTRAIDTLTVSSLPWYNQTKGTFICNAVHENNWNDPHYVTQLSFNDGTHNNYMQLGTTNGGTPFCQNGVAGSGTQVLGVSAIGQALMKQGLSYQSGNNIVCSNGTINNNSNTLGTAGVPAGISEMNVNNIPGNNQYFNGWMQSIRYWNYPLTSTQLQAFTK